MPFTPFHLGPGAAIKSVTQGSFSFMVFGWTQILMDVQPLLVLFTGEGHLHGFTHTYIGAILIAGVAVVSGKHLSELMLKFIFQREIIITWPIVIISALVGSFSHVFLDSLMHADLQPFYPFIAENMFLGLISISALHKFCVYSGGVGALIYFFVQGRMLWGQS